MDVGFFHPERGYWQTIGEVSDEVRASYPSGTVEVPLRPGPAHEWIDGAWVEDPEGLLAIERASMRCTPLQGKLALGETRWAQVEAILADPVTPWAMRITLASATEWMRNSQSITELAWLLNLTDGEVDDLFRLAATIEV